MKDEVLTKDLAAYQRLRHDGIQPRGIDGSAGYEARANTKFEIESGNLLPKEVYGKDVERKVKEGMAIAAELRDQAS